MRRGRIIIFVVVALAGIGWAAYAWWNRKFTYELPPGPVVAYKVDGDYTTTELNPKVVHHWAILEERATDEVMAAKIRAALNDSANYKLGGGSKCFNPGMGFRIGTGKDTIEILICLHCKHIYFYDTAAEDMASGAKVISAEGVENFGRLYDALFTKSSTTNPTTKSSRDK